MGNYLCMLSLVTIPTVYNCNNNENHLQFSVKETIFTFVNPLKPIKTTCSRKNASLEGL